MKQFILISCLSAVLFLCGCSNKPDSLKEYNLKGDVVSIDIKTYRAESKFGKVEKGNLLASYEGLCAFIEFENRFIKEETIFDWKGEIEKKNIYNYDQDYNLLRIDGYNEDGNIEKKTTYKWENGHVVEIKETDSKNKEIFKIVQEYDGGKHPVRSIHYYEGEKRSEHILHYKGDKLISYDEIDEKGKKTKHEHKYDGDLLVEATIYHPVTIKYDDNGNPIEIKGGQYSPMGYWSTWESAKNDIYYYEYNCSIYI